MRNEITAAVLFLVQLIEKSEKFSPDQLECFRRHLVELLTARFKNHWFPDKPFKGQGYRCIRVNGNNRRDETLESAASAAGVKYEDLTLPMELTLWVDPKEVCCRFGESKGSFCTLASFDEKENTIPILKKIIRIEEMEVKETESLPSVQKRPTTPTSEQQQQPKSKPLSTTNQNQQHSNGGTGRKRNVNSPRLHLNRNRSWFNHAFNMGYGPHPMSQPWYNIMPPHFLGGPSPPPFMGHRGNKWVPPSYPTGPARFHHWSPKATLKV